MKSNVEFVQELMEFSKNGAITQVFVIEALRYYSKKVLQHGKLEDESGNFISNRAWHATAKEIETRLTEKYGKHE